MPLSSTIRPPRRRAVAVALASAVCLLSTTAWTATASADEVLATTPAGIDILSTQDTAQTCTAPQVISAFASLGDPRDYVLAPGGDFEQKSLDGWQVTKDTQQDGDKSNLVIAQAQRDDNKHSLRIRANGSAVSPAMCVDLHYPTLRFMAKPEQAKGELKVQVAYPDSDNPVFQDAGTIVAGKKAWSATADLPVYPERGGAAPGMRRVALRFVSVAGATGAGDWKIDDLYVDPKRL
jgi:hypothetical protein